MTSIYLTHKKAVRELESLKAEELRRVFRDATGGPSTQQIICVFLFIG